MAEVITFPQLLCGMVGWGSVILLFLQAVNEQQVENLWIRGCSIWNVKIAVV